jgi:putative FmdB family regulatory protein
MPMYEYRCNHCGEISEILVGTSPDGEMLTCNHCGSSNLKKILSVSSFTFADSRRAPDTTCCGRAQRCDTPPCTSGETCRRGQ